jgi:hypothetical protein
MMATRDSPAVLAIGPEQPANLHMDMRIYTTEISRQEVNQHGDRRVVSYYTLEHR